MKAVPYTDLYDLEEAMERNRKRRMRNRVANTKMFKLRDPKTGLFWSSQAIRADFNNQGRKWGSEKAAVRNWGEYVHAGHVSGDDRPALELVTFHVEVTEKKASKDKKPDMRGAAALEGLQTRNHGLVTFAKDVCHSGFDLKYLIECEAAPEAGMKLPDGVSGIKVKPERHRGGWSADLPDELVIAVNNAKDLIFLKMALSDFIIAIYDIDEMILLHDEKLKAEKTIRRRAIKGLVERAMEDSSV